MGVAACPTAADVCWMDKSTHNPLGLAAGSSHGPFLLFAFLFFSCFFLPTDLSLSLFLSSRFLRFFACVLFIFHFLDYFFGASQARRRTGIYHCGRKLAASFPVYTHRHTFAHSSTYTIAQSLPLFVSQCKQTKNNYTAQRPSFSSTSRQRGL